MPTLTPPPMRRLLIHLHCLKLDASVLFLSRSIVQNKKEYYAHLQLIRETGEWESRIIFMLNGIRQTSQQTMVVIEGFRIPMENQKHHLREKYKYYRRELLDLLYSRRY